MDPRTRRHPTHRARPPLTLHQGKQSGDADFLAVKISAARSKSDIDSSVHVHKHKFYKVGAQLPTNDKKPKYRHAWQPALLLLIQTTLHCWQTRLAQARLLDNGRKPVKQRVKP